MSHKRVIGYTRVSTTDQADRGVGLEVQRNAITLYCELHGLELLRTVQDSYSGRTIDRPEFNAVLHDLRRDAADGVVVHKLDRLTRSIVDLGNLLSEFFGPNAECPKDLHAVMDHIDTGTANGRLQMNLLVTITQWEREVIAERTKTALQERISQGKVAGNIPYGYRRIEGTDRIEECPKEQAIIKQVYALYRAGLSLRHIARHLNGCGYSSRTGGKVYHSQIRSIVQGYESSAGDEEESDC